MKLTAKIVSIFLLAIFLLTAIHGWITVGREDQRLTQEMESRAQYLGRAMEERIVVAWREGGHDGVFQVVRSANDRHQKTTVRWVTLDTAHVASAAPAAPKEHLRRASIEKIVSVTRYDEQGGPRHHMYYPIDVSERRTGCLEFSESLSDVDAYTRETTQWEVALFSAIAICGVAVTFAGVRLVGRPLQQLIRKTEQIGEGDFSEPLHLSGRDELSQLAESLNQMSDRLSQSRDRVRKEEAARLSAVNQLRHVDRLNTVGRLASGVAHELGTPLNVVAGRARLIYEGQLDEQQIQESAQDIETEAKRMTAIIRQLLDFARRGKSQRVEVDLRHVAQQALDLLETLATKNNVTLVLEGDQSPLMLKIDAGQIQQVLTNLIVNAVQSMAEGGTVTVSLKRKHLRPPDDQDNTEGTYYRIAVHDEGCGIGEEQLSMVFEPFYTTKEVGVGTGLGLSVSYGIVQDHGGWIDVESERGQGSCFSVYLPEEPNPCSDES